MFSVNFINKRSVLITSILISAFTYSNVVNSNSYSNSISGTESAEQLLGTNESDLIIGLGGDDQIYGFSGNDRLEGGENNDRLQGGNGSNSGSGNDLLIGGNGNDILVGEDGDDTLEGGSGDDHYYYSSNTGVDLIIDPEEGQDVLFFLDVPATRLSFHQDTQDLLVLVDADILQQVRVVDYFSSDGSEIIVQPNGGYSILPTEISSMLTPLPGSGGGQDGDGDQSVNDPEDGSSSDNPVLSLEDIDNDNNIIGTSENDLLVAGAGLDELSGGTGDDLLLGGLNDDIYQIDLANGSDIISDYDGNNRIIFSSSISFSDIASSLTRSSDNLILKIANTDNQVTVENFFSVSDTISSIEFSNGQSISSTQLFAVFGTNPPTITRNSKTLVIGNSDANTLAGSELGDIIITGEGNDTLRGLAGDDYLVGGSGDDVYEINLNSGKDRIIDSSGSNKIVFSTDIYFNDVASGLSKSDNDLILTVSNSDNKIIIHQFFKLRDTIDVLEFSSGGQINASQLYGVFGVSPPTESAVIHDLLDYSGNSDPNADDDNDGVNNDVDLCPFTPANQIADSNGCAQSQLDDDNDGLNNLADLCPNTPPGETIDENGCTDSERDSDDDGIFDAFDQCDNTPEGSNVDLQGCHDSDGDGVSEQYDLCPLTDSGKTTDGDGCALNQKDTDSDGLNDELDMCPGTNPNSTPNAQGCAIEQLDTDSDGVNDSLDQCPNTIANFTVDVVGCAENQRDSDNDGQLDYIDSDDDNDGVLDNEDAFPLDPSEQLDTDSDGLGNNTDLDDDGDTYADIIEIDAGTDPLLWSSNPWNASEVKSMVPMTGTISTVASFDDGHNRSGSPRIFHRNDEHEYVKDEITGLLWQDSIDSKNLKLNWADANSACLNSELGGITTWRLPSRYELLFLTNLESVDRGFRDPIINKEFKNVYRYDGWSAKSYLYWTSDRDASDGLAFSINFANSGVVQQSTSNTLNLRCVSGESSFNRFYHLRSEDIVYTQGLGLMWQDTPEVTDFKANWVDALNYCEGLNLAGHQDWRLPNVFEANTIVEHLATTYTPQFKYTHPRSGSEPPYWWLSNSRFDPAYNGEIENVYSSDHAQTQAYRMYAYPGTFKQTSRYKSDLNFVRCVRTYSAPKVIIAPIPEVITTGESISLDATQSYDPDGTVQSYSWFDITTLRTVSDEPILTLSDLAAGSYELYVKVTDNNGVSTRKDIEFTVERAQIPPIAVAGDDQLINSGGHLILDASSSSDPYGDVTSYQWVNKGTSEVVSSSAVVDLGVLETGTYSFELTVVNDIGLSSKDSLIVTVEPSNEPPVVKIKGNQNITVGDNVELDGAESYDSDGNIASWMWNLGGSTVGSSNSIILSGLDVGIHIVELHVTDNDGASSSKSIDITVIEEPENLAPVANAGVDQTIVDGEAAQLNANGSYDPENESLTYQWVDKNRLLLSDQQTFSLNGLSVGRHDIELIVTDAGGLWAQDKVTVVVLEQQFNELTSCPIEAITNDSEFLDEFPENDIPWKGHNWLSVYEIEKAFNYARKIDNSVKKYLIMPDQAEWDSFTIEQKGLFLVNSERIARGLKPFDGVSEEVTSVAQAYSEYHTVNNLVVGHYTDGKSPEDRLDEVNTIQNYRDDHIIPESGYAVYQSSEPVDKNAVIVEAIYNWIYIDKVPYQGKSWGHRSHILQTGLKENSGIQTSEGALGFGISTGVYDPFNEQVEGKMQGAVVFINTVDPSDSWNLDQLQIVNTDQSLGCNNQVKITVDGSVIDNPNLAGLKIVSTNLMLVENETTPITVIASFNDGSEQDISNSVSFIADDRSVVSLDSGLLMALNEGYAIVYAELNGITSNRVWVTVGKPTDAGNLIDTDAEGLINHIPANASLDEYDPKIVSVYTGDVFNKLGVALGDVQISFLNHPEYGSVKTDVDGRFIIAAPSGLQTIVFEKPNHLTIQRKAIGQSSSWSNVATVTLLEYDSKKTFIDLSSGQAQVHESSVITDEFGTRKATVVFNNISQATVLSADGSERSLNGFSLTATEYETPESMPGEMPEHSVFTYCTKLHVEGTQYNDTVMFDNNVVMFVDNFLDFEVGEIIPVGYFDMIESAWIPSDNGIVVRLLDANNDGVVDGLDLDDDGIADDLNNNGSTIDDATGLDNYSAGDTLWWGAFNHFTSVDYNLAGSDGRKPEDSGSDGGKEDEKNNETECTGSYVMPYQQSLHEDIPIAGTDLTLHYTSQRTKDYAHKISIKVSGDELDPNVVSMTARLEIAGKVYEQEFSPATNVMAEIIWDGMDISGNRPNGKVSGLIRVGYEYDSTYQSVGNVQQSSLSGFSAFSAFSVAWNQPGVNDTGVTTRDTYVSWLNRGINLQNTYHSQIAEGWSLSNVHELDPVGTLYKGDGSVVDVVPQSNIVKTGQTYSHISGDDGFYQRGGQSIDYSITDKNTVIDNNTKLEWSNIEEPFEANSLYSANLYCEDLSIGLLSDWRLPTIKERSYTLSKSGQQNLPRIFSATGKAYWTTQTAELGETLDVVCVRGNKIDDIYIENHKVNTSSDIVVDKDNGLMWQDTPDNSSLEYNWEDSINYCEDLQHASYDDWRLPNINELMYALPNQSFNYKTNVIVPEADGYWDYEQDYVQAYWASTSHFSDENLAWAVESKGFYNNRFNKNRELHVRCVRDDATSARIPFKFNNKGQQTATIDIDTGIELVTYHYNNSGKLQRMVDQFGNTITINRTPNGKVTSIVAPDGEVTQLSIDTANNLDSVRYDDGTSYNFYYDGSLLTDKINPEGHAYSRAYDSEGRVSQTGDSEGGLWSFFDEKTRYGENRYGFNTIEGRSYQTIRTTLENGDIQKITLGKDGSTHTNILQADKLRETQIQYGVVTVTDNVIDEKTKEEIPSQITVTYPSGLSSTTNLNKRYGENGTRTTQKILSFNVNGRVSQLEIDALSGTEVSTSPEGRVSTTLRNPQTQKLISENTDGLTPTDYQYDSRGRLKSIITGDRTTTYDYSDVNDRGNVSYIQAPDGKKTYYDYDELGRITKTTYPDGHATQTEYDANGNTRTIIVPTIEDHGFTYTGVDKVKSQSTPLNEATEYQYDRDRRLTHVNLPSGESITHTYSAGKLDTTETPEATIEYAYIQGNLPLSITEGGESLAYSYDGNLVTQLAYAGQLDNSIQQTYDSNLWLKTLSYAGQVTRMDYDNDGLLTDINGYTIARHALHGLPQSITDNKLEQTWQVNGFGESTNVTSKVNNQRTYDYSLTRNLLGQITGKTETLSNGSTFNYVYSYDDKNRLIQVTKDNSVVESYAYDANGNRTLQTNTLTGVTNQAATFNIADQQQTDGTTQFEYDANGRLSKRINSTLVEEYTYSSQGRLLGVVFKDTGITTKTIAYQHNALGNRVAKLVDGLVVEKYLWLDKTTLLATYDQNDNVLQRFEYGLGHTPISFTQAGNKYYITSDHLGSPRTISDSTGTILKSIEYDSFGNVISDSNPAIEIPFGFAGGLIDQDTTLVRFGYRDYDPSIGRWTARDPIGFAGGDTNLYGYVASDPVNFFDINGLWSVSFDAYVGVGGGITIGQNDKTGNWFVETRLGIGVGGGASVDVLNNGPETRTLKDSPYGPDNSNLVPGSDGTSIGTYAGFGGSLGPWDYSVGGQAGKQLYGSGAGCSYSTGPTAGPGFNPAGAIGGGFGISFGGAIGVTGSIW